MKKTIISAMVLVLSPLCTSAQIRTLNEYMQAVAEKNVSYLAEKYNIDIAVSNIQAARIFNDPELSLDYGNNQDWYLEMGQSVEVGLSYDLDIAGVRRSGIKVAKSEKDVTEASVAAFLSGLRLEAASAWADAWRLRESVGILRETMEDMQRIAKNDSLRFVLGDISKADALQSKLEANSLEGEYLMMESEYRNALLSLSDYCGGDIVTDMDADLPKRSFSKDREELFTMAEYNRADLKVAELTRTLSENNLALVKASRSFDMGISLGYSYNTEVRNEIAPAPKYNGLTVGVSIPLKFSSMNRGEVNAARAGIQQAERAYEAALMQVRTEVSQALNSLDAARTVLARYDSSMLGDAREIMESRRMGYLKGDSSILELITAQQTYRDVMQGYIDASADLFLRQIELEYAIGDSNSI